MYYYQMVAIGIINKEDISTKATEYCLKFKEDIGSVKERRDENDAPIFIIRKCQELELIISTDSSDSSGWSSNYHIIHTTSPRVQILVHFTLTTVPFSTIP